MIAYETLTKFMRFATATVRVRVRVRARVRVRVRVRVRGREAMWELRVSGVSHDYCEVFFWSGNQKADSESAGCIHRRMEYVENEGAV